MRYKLCKLCEIVQGIRPCGAFIFQISVKSELKFQFWGSYTLVVAPMGVKFGMEEGTFGPVLRAKFHPHRCNVSPLRGEKPQNRPLSKLNTGRFALRAMLPVIIIWVQDRNCKKMARENFSIGAFYNITKNQDNPIKL